MNRTFRRPASRAGLLLSCLFAFAATAATPSATIDLPAKAKWHRMTSLGLLLVGTDDALLLVNGETGQVQWQRDDIKKTLPYNVRDIPGSPVVLVNDWSGAMAAKVSARGLNIATGQDVFQTEPEMGQSLGIYPVPDRGMLLNVAQLNMEGSGIFLTAFESTTGKKLWRTKIAGMMGFQLYPAETGGFIVTKQDLSGHQDPVFDGDTAYLPFQGLMAVDLNTGAVKWNNEFAVGANKELKKAYAEPVVDGDTVFASGKGTVYAIDKASGAIRWKSDKILSGIFSSGAISQVLPASDTVYVRLGGNFFNYVEKGYELKTPLGVMALDRATGTKKWEYKDAKDGITNLVYLPEAGIVMMSDAHELSGLLLTSSGKAAKKFEVPIEFKRKISGGEMAAAGIGALSGLMTGGLGGALQGGFGAASSKGRLDVPVALIPRRDGSVIVAGKQHLMAFDPAAQKINWSTYFPAPGSNSLGLAAMSALTLVAATTYGVSAAQGGMSQAWANNSNASNYGSLGAMAQKRFAASQQARDYAYVLTTVTEGKESGVGLMAISLATGEPGTQVLLHDKEPEYAVDDLTGRLYYFNDKKQLLVYPLR
jgi:outer membrane protein assembly factor BamB